MSAPDALRDQLQTSLGTAYSLERELGGGGMSRVFVARDEALGRDVVVKVLAPELAEGLSAERFAREIRLAASLQQANVVPVLAAGVTADGLPYFTMPFVDGLSLRQRLERGAVPIADAISILRDVARALAYAHGRGVVHRDIKPDNVLLSGATAVVTDFGIAKAISASRTQAGAERGRGGDGVRTESLTQLGMALGTPAYMAPEQAAGDPATDHRADVYAFGCLAYELLAGRPPFHGLAPQRLLAAHMAERPRDVTELRADTPPALAALVTRCLEKDPAHRPQRAAELLDALDAVSTGGTTAAPAPIPTLRTGRKRALVLTAAAIGVLALLVGGYLATRALGIGPAGSLLAAGRLRAQEPLLVADFASRGDTTLGRVVADAVKADLAQSDAVTLVPEARVADALQRMQRAPGTRLLYPVARDLAEREGIKAVVDGEVTPLGGGYLVVLRLVSADSGAMLASYRAVADSPRELIDVVGTLTRKLRRRIGESLQRVQASPTLADATTSSLPALRKYSEARRTLNETGNRQRYLRLLRDAVALDTTFAQARGALAVELNFQGGAGTEVAALSEAAYPLRDRLPEYERLLIEATYFRYGPPAVRDGRRAIAALEARAAHPQDRGRSLNDLALLVSRTGDLVRAESLLRRAVETDSSLATPFGNLVRMQLLNGRVAAAETTFARLRARFPSNVTMLAYEPYLFLARGARDSAERAIEALRARTAEDAGIRPRLTRWQADLAADGGRLDEQRRLLDEQRAARQARDAGRGNGGDLYHATIRAATLALVADDRTGALRLLDSAVARSPIASIGLLERPYAALARAYAYAGRPDRARPYLAELERQSAGERDLSSGDALFLARANVAIAERRWDEALRAVGGKPFGSNPHHWHLARAQAHDGRGDRDSAVAAYERFLVGDVLFEAAPHGPALRRLAELYGAKGDTARAIRRYRELVTLWRRADPVLQPKVVDVKRRLAALERREAAAR